MANMQLILRALVPALLALCACTHARNTPVQARWNVTCMLVFGDSTVDAGNNNRLGTDFKANFLPYGRDFFDGRPTGRFCDGRLATDFIAESLGISTIVPAFLDPTLTPEQLKHGVSFASASSGYDELTAMNAGVLSFPKQIEYLKHYKLHLQKLVGYAEAQKIIKDSLVLISAGTNDFLENYYFYDNRSKTFTEPQYEDYLISLMSEHVKEINKLGAKRFLLVGVPPMGCLPVIRTLMGTKGCFGKYNDIAVSFNSKIVTELSVLKQQLGVKAAYLDIYTVALEASEQPRKYGITETAKGCCGSGTIEVGETCKGQRTCKDPRSYIYWDAVHPTQRLNKIVADKAITCMTDELLG